MGLDDQLKGFMEETLSRLGVPALLIPGQLPADPGPVVLRGVVRATGGVSGVS